MTDRTADRRWILGWGAVLAAVVIGLPFAFHGMFGGSDKVFVYAGAVATTIVALIAHTLTRQQNQRLAAQNAEDVKHLRLDAAMRAGELFAANGAQPVDPATAASGLLALTRLDQTQLAVALLVDLWSDRQRQVSTETAILVIDAALRSDQPSAQLVAAELLCRNAETLNACQSLHWPSMIDGGWDRRLGPKTKFLLFEALLNMTLKSPPNENALRSVAVRLYGIWELDTEPRIKGCVGTLIKVLVPRMQKLGYSDFIQGNRKVTLAALRNAAACASDNPDEFLHRIVRDYAERLDVWASGCRHAVVSAGGMAAAVCEAEVASGR